MCGRTDPAHLYSGDAVVNLTHFWQYAVIVSKIRPEQMSHKKFLRRGRNVRALQYSLLILAALAAAAGVWAVFALSGLGLDS